MRPRRRPNNCQNESCLKGVKISRRRPVGDTGKVAGGKSAIGRHYQAGLSEAACSASKSRCSARPFSNSCCCLGAKPDLAARSYDGERGQDIKGDVSTSLTLPKSRMIMVLKIRLFLRVITTSYPIPISKLAPTLFPPISDQRQ